MNPIEPRVQAPALDAYSDLPLYNTKAVVHQTGVPAPTLRAWERRYGILSPRRGENDYRLYSERDMMVVAWLRERVETGMTISQAIALLRSLEPVRRKGRRGRPLPGAPAEPAMAAPAARQPDLYALDILGATLLRQLSELDEVAAVRTITQALAVYTVEDVCLHLFRPVLVEIGRRWADGSLGVTVEHFAAALIRAQLDSLFRSAPGQESGPLVLVGCAPGELHELGALMLALFLRRAGLHVAYVGQSVEAQSLASTVAALKPACVALSATLPARIEALTDAARGLLARPGAPLFCFGGQAFEASAELAEGVPGQFLGSDARHAVDEIKRKLTA
ncbi:MAG TPA: cobalamin-dependent protein [Ktedonobacterales bacterium]|nr:cobalamin-dependent protein [Ktedonobacterales bacterium]